MLNTHLFELNGWDTHFLGVNTPVDHMLEYIQDAKSDPVGVSISIFFNFPTLKTSAREVRSKFPNMMLVILSLKGMPI